MTKEEAKALDEILSRFTSKSWRTIIEDENLYNILSGYGYVTLNCTTEDGFDVMLTNEGDKFRASNKFEHKLNAENIDTEIKKWSIINAKTATIIAVISLIFAILSLILDFAWKC